MADPDDHRPWRFKIYDYNYKTVEIPTEQVSQYPTFEQHFICAPSCGSNIRRLKSMCCSCVVDIVAVFLSDGKFFNLHTDQCCICRCRSTDYFHRAVAIYDFAAEFELDILAILVLKQLPEFSKKPRFLKLLEDLYLLAMARSLKIRVGEEGEILLGGYLSAFERRNEFHDTMQVKFIRQRIDNQMKARLRWLQKEASRRAETMRRQHDIL
ncbi:hypothetical protein FBEOM_3418 [Fusarium beomiforme]|uniref:Uncharacterized protein n=1 Tax=Fusarium beomiforme TaxID=44412 RepID=A0A9P5APQ2_9HYPO|nr:hypothetical protein FBEOM_3418 [Fusarium beomiforme]